MGGASVKHAGRFVLAKIKSCVAITRQWSNNWEYSVEAELEKFRAIYGCRSVAES
jgi:hypothetical protein